LHGPNDDGRDHAEENPGKQHFLPALELRHFVCCHEFYHYYRKHEDTKNQKNEYADTPLLAVHSLYTGIEARSFRECTARTAGQDHRPQKQLNSRHYAPETDNYLFTKKNTAFDEGGIHLKHRISYLDNQGSVYELNALIFLVIVIDEEAIDKRGYKHQDDDPQQH